MSTTIPVPDDITLTAPRAVISREMSTPRPATPMRTWHPPRWVWTLAGIAGGLALIAATIFHYLFFLTQPNKPTKFYLVESLFEVAVAALIALSAGTLGVTILRRFPASSFTRLERALLAYALGTGALALGTAVIGLLHGWYFPIILAAIVAPLAILRRDMARVLAAANPTGPRFALAELQPRTVFESGIFAGVALVGALVAEHTLAPFWSFDVFMYHFALPERFLALHEMFGSPGIPQANLPYNNEMLNLLALNFRAEVAAGMLQTGFVAATCLALFALGARLLSRRIAWLGMAIFLVMPLVLYYASSGLIDQQFAFMALRDRRGGWNIARSPRRVDCPGGHPDRNRAGREISGRVSGGPMMVPLRDGRARVDTRAVHALVA